MATVTKLMKDIASVKIQGATNVAKAGLQGLVITAKKSKSKERHAFISELKSYVKEVSNLRSTEPLLKNMLGFVVGNLTTSSITDVKELKQLTEVASDEALNMMQKNREIIAKIGAETIADGMKILTHCHASTVMAILKEAHRCGKKFEVICTESRPLFQGRKSAAELIEAGLSVTMVIDSNVANIIKEVNAVYIGSDMIALNGDIANKIGSFMISKFTKELNIPLYVCSDLGKLDFSVHDSKGMPIEERKSDEVWPKAPSNLKILNPAFDAVPSENIAGYICQEGILDKTGFKQAVEERKKSAIVD